MDRGKQDSGLLVMKKVAVMYQKKWLRRLIISIKYTLRTILRSATFANCTGRLLSAVTTRKQVCSLTVSNTGSAAMQYKTGFGKISLAFNMAIETRNFLICSNTRKTFLHHHQKTMRHFSAYILCLGRTVMRGTIAGSIFSNSAFSKAAHYTRNTSMSAASTRSFQTS